MSKRGKLQNRERRAAQNQRDAFADLTLAARLIGDLFGSNSQCLRAAGFMMATARDLGHKVEPRLVSALGASSQGGFVTGTVAAQAAANMGMPAPTVEPGSNFAVDWAGHAVVVLRNPPTLIDANFRQFQRAGFPEVSLVMKAKDIVPTEGLWKARFSAEAVVYYLPDDRGAERHLKTICGFAEQFASAATVLADMVRAGAEPDDPSWVPAFLALHPSLGQMP